MKHHCVVLSPHSSSLLRHEKIAKESENIGLISQLIIAEFLRNNNKDGTPALTREQVSQDPGASEAIADESKRINDALFGGLKCWRVKVVGSERQDINGRQGTLRSWNDAKKKFCVGLDTKRGQDSDARLVEEGHCCDTDKSQAG
jgi:hypothetical protein